MKKEYSSYANHYLRELAAGVSQYTFADELQSGAFSFLIWPNGNPEKETVETSLTILSGN